MKLIDLNKQNGLFANTLDQQSEEEQLNLIKNLYVLGSSKVFETLQPSIWTQAYENGTFNQIFQNTANKLAQSSSTPVIDNRKQEQEQSDFQQPQKNIQNERAKPCTNYEQNHSETEDPIQILSLPNQPLNTKASYQNLQELCSNTDKQKSHGVSERIKTQYNKQEILSDVKFLKDKLEYLQKQVDIEELKMKREQNENYITYPQYQQNSKFNRKQYYFSDDIDNMKKNNSFFNQKHQYQQQLYYRKDVTEKITSSPPPRLKDLIKNKPILYKGYPPHLDDRQIRKVLYDENQLQRQSFVKKPFDRNQSPDKTQQILQIEKKKFSNDYDIIESQKQQNQNKQSQIQYFVPNNDISRQVQQVQSNKYNENQVQRSNKFAAPFQRSQNKLLSFSPYQSNYFPNNDSIKQIQQIDLSIQNENSRVNQNKYDIPFQTLNQSHIKNSSKNDNTFNDFKLKNEQQNDKHEIKNNQIQSDSKQISNPQEVINQQNDQQQIQQNQQASTDIQDGNNHPIQQSTKQTQLPINQQLNSTHISQQAQNPQSQPNNFQQQMPQSYNYPNFQQQQLHPQNISHQYPHIYQQTNTIQQQQQQFSNFKQLLLYQQQQLQQQQQYLFDQQQSISQSINGQLLQPVNGQYQQNYNNQFQQTINDSYQQQGPNDFNPQVLQQYQQTQQYQAYQPYQQKISENFGQQEVNQNQINSQRYRHKDTQSNELVQFLPINSSSIQGNDIFENQQYPLQNQQQVLIGQDMKNSQSPLFLSNIKQEFAPIQNNIFNQNQQQFLQNSNSFSLDWNQQSFQHQPYNQFQNNFLSESLRNKYFVQQPKYYPQTDNLNLGQNDDSFTPKQSKSKSSFVSYQFSQNPDYNYSQQKNNFRSPKNPYYIEQREQNLEDFADSFLFSPLVKHLTNHDNLFASAGIPNNTTYNNNPYLNNSGKMSFNRKSKVFSNQNNMPLDSFYGNQFTMAIPQQNTFSSSNIDQKQSQVIGSNSIYIQNQAQISPYSLNNSNDYDQKNPFVQDTSKISSNNQQQQNNDNFMISQAHGSNIDSSNLNTNKMNSSYTMNSQNPQQKHKVQISQFNDYNKTFKNDEIQEYKPNLKFSQNNPIQNNLDSFGIDNHMIFSDNMNSQKKENDECGYDISTKKNSINQKENVSQTLTTENLSTKLSTTQKQPEQISSFNNNKTIDNQ